MFYFIKFPFAQALNDIINDFCIYLRSDIHQKLMNIKITVWFHSTLTFAKPNITTVTYQDDLVNYDTLVRR